MIIIPQLNHEWLNYATLDITFIMDSIIQKHLRAVLYSLLIKVLSCAYLIAMFLTIDIAVTLSFYVNL